MSTSGSGATSNGFSSVAEPPTRPSKIPQITALFWLITILVAGLGQAIFDWLIVMGVADPDLVPVVLGGELVLFLLALTLQLVGRRYVAPVYWFAVIGVSIFGTLLADVAHFLIGIPLWASPLIFALVVAVTFLLWYRAEHSLSVDTIRTRRREMSYWVAVLFIFALGTSLVDLVTTALNVNALVSGVVFLVLFAAAAALSLRLRRATVLLFWAAYVFARPASGSFSDWLANDLALGASIVALVAFILIVLLVGYSTLVDRRRSTLR